MAATDSKALALSAIARARAAQRGWAATPLRARIECFRGLPEWIAAQADELAATVAGATGKTLFDALSAEVLPSALAADHCLRRAEGYLKPQRLRGGSLLALNKRSMLHRAPWGVVGIIAPWNYPLSIPVFDIIAALMCGNTVVFKTAPETAPVGIAIERMIASTGVPAGVFNLVNLDGPDAGEAFLGAGGVDKLSFTGSVAVGRWLSARAAERLVPVSLELGGKDAMIVCDDAGLDRAANGAVWAGLHNSGQTCAAVERIYVQRSVYDRFLQLLAERVTSLRVGTDIGAMCTPRQTEKVRAQVANALGAGARVLASAAVPEHLADGLFIAPLVLVDVTHDMDIMREETFGPVLAVVPVDDDDQAIAMANDSPYGLTASVWTADRDRGQRIAAQLEAGVVTINDHLLSHGMMETPWGGFKDSGSGRTHGRFSFEAMTQTRTVIDERLPWLRRNAFWYPVDDGAYAALRGTLRAMYGPLSTRIRHLPAVLRLFARMFR